MDELPFISVVIPVWNSPDLIAKCLTAIRAQTYPSDRYEVLVVDNGSTDETAEVVRSFWFATLLSEPITSSYRARNLGLKAARGEYVAFTDADCIPDPQWLAAAAGAAREHRHASVLAGRIQLFRATSGSNRWCEKYESLYSFNQAKNVRNGFCVTANWMSPRKTLLDLGGFDVELKSGGDVDLSRRIRAMGQAIVYIPDMVTRHPMRGSLHSLMAKRRRTVGGLWQSQVPPRRFHTSCIAMIRQFVWTVRKTLLDPRLSLVDRARVSAVVAALWAIGMIELIRLACGGESKRA